MHCGGKSELRFCRLNSCEYNEGNPMKMINSMTFTAAILAVIVTVTGCSGMSRQDKNTAVGAGVGAAGGAILTGGSAVGTVGGAAVGAVIGHEVDK